jgi:hypothetical protein
MNHLLKMMNGLKSFYELEIEKLNGVVQRLEVYIDQGIAFRREVADSAAVLKRAVEDLGKKIEAQQRGEDIGDDWWQGN